MGGSDGSGLRKANSSRSLLVERDEAGGVRGPDPRPSVANRLVRDRELPEVVADHLRLDLHTVHGLACTTTKKYTQNKEADVTTMMMA